MNRGYLYIALTAVIFSTMEPVGKLLADDLPPMSLVLIRFLLGGLVLLPFALADLKRRGVRLGPQDYLFIASVSSLFITIMIVFQTAVMYTKASTAAIIFSVNPVFTIPLAAVLLQEKPGKKTLIPLLISIAGICAFLEPQASLTDLKGIGLAVFSALLFSLYSVFIKKRLGQYGGLALTSLTFLFGSSLLSVYAFFWRVDPLSGISPGNIWYLLYMSIIVAGGGYLLYFLSMRESSAIAASTAFLIKPALSPIASFIILGEKLTVNSLIGMVLVMTGSIWLLGLRSEIGKKQPLRPTAKN